VRKIDVLEAASTLEQLVDDLESGRKREVVITKDGRPAAKLLPILPDDLSRRIGIAKGKFEVPDEITDEAPGWPTEDER